MIQQDRAASTSITIEIMASCSQTSTYPDPNVTVANLPSAGEFPSYQIAIIVCAATTSFVATIFVGLRIFTRWFMLHLWGWEDWMMVLALLFGYAMSEAFIHGISISIQ